jgi:hypothetical protein
MAFGIVSTKHFSPKQVGGRQAALEIVYPDSL